MSKHLMIDIETFGDTSNSVIVSIGAIRFDMETGELFEQFYDRIDIDSCLKAGLKINGSTLRWWLTRNEESRQEVAKAGSELAKVLHNFGTFINEEDTIWSNGLRFDVSLLEDAYRILDLKVPWDFHNERDVRTLMAFDDTIKERYVKENKGIHHHPIDDCKLQIKYCSEIYNKLKL